MDFQRPVEDLRALLIKKREDREIPKLGLMLPIYSRTNKPTHAVHFELIGQEKIVQEYIINWEITDQHFWLAPWVNVLTNEPGNGFQTVERRPTQAQPRNEMVSRNFINEVTGEA